MDLAKAAACSEIDAAPREELAFRQLPNEKTQATPSAFAQLTSFSN